MPADRRCPRAQLVNVGGSPKRLDGPTGLAGSLWSRPMGAVSAAGDLGLSARHHRRVRALLLWCSLSRPGANLYLRARRLVIVRDCPSESVTVRQRPRAHAECDVNHILSPGVGTGGRPAVDAHDQDPRENYRASTRACRKTGADQDAYRTGSGLPCRRPRRHGSRRTRRRRDALRQASAGTAHRQPRQPNRRTAELSHIYRSRRRRKRRRGSAPALGLSLGRPGGRAPAHTRMLPQISQAHPGTQPVTALSRLPRRSIVPLAASASRALPAVASHAIGFADPRPGSHSQGIGACRGRRG